jgi:hypothetical protein
MHSKSLQMIFIDTGVHAIHWKSHKIKVCGNNLIRTVFIAHISISRMLPALGVYIQLYRGCPVPIRIEPGSPAC